MSLQKKNSEENAKDALCLSKKLTYQNIALLVQPGFFLGVIEKPRLEGLGLSRFRHLELTSRILCQGFDLKDRERCLLTSNRAASL